MHWQALGTRGRFVYFQICRCIDFDYIRIAAEHAFTRASSRILFDSKLDVLAFPVPQGVLYIKDNHLRGLLLSSKNSMLLPTIAKCNSDHMASNKAWSSDSRYRPLCM